MPNYLHTCFSDVHPGNHDHICKSSPMIHCGNHSFLEVTWQIWNVWKWKWNVYVLSKVVKTSKDKYLEWYPLCYHGVSLGIGGRSLSNENTCFFKAFQNITFSWNHSTFIIMFSVEMNVCLSSDLLFVSSFFMFL